VEFDTVHVAAYSPRPGTAAARTLADDVPPKEKKSESMLPIRPETKPVKGPKTTPKSIGIATVGLTAIRPPAPGIVKILNGIVSAAYSAVPTAIATICFAEKNDLRAKLAPSFEAVTGWGVVDRPAD
jgi:hypothetical protein